MNLTRLLLLHIILSITNFPVLAEETPNTIHVYAQPFSELATRTTHEAGATVLPKNDTAVSAQISAVIKDYRVDTGDVVRQGDVLAELDCDRFILVMKQAQATLAGEKALLDNAIKQLNQARALKKQGNVSIEIYNQRIADQSRLQASVKAAEFALELARLDVKHCTITAPFDGFITQRFSAEGTLTQPGIPLLQIVSSNDPQLEAQINPPLFTGFINGENYQYHFRDASYPVTIKKVLPVLDSRTHTHTVRLTFTDNSAITGSVGKLSWQDKSWSLPASLLVSRKQVNGIFLAKNDRAVFYPLPQAKEGHPIVVHLPEQTLVVTTGRFTLNEGDHIKVDITSDR